MKVLLVGGSGYVGTFVTPYLQRHHDIRVFDLVPPKHSVDYVEGSITDPEAVRRALDEMDTFVTVVMKSGQGGSTRDHTVAQTIDNYHVNCLGIHLLLYTAQEMGIMTGVHTSTMSVHNRNRTWYPSEDETPLDGPNVYGLTKGFAEQICRYFAREFGMNLTVLRITGPADRARYIALRKNPPDGPKLYYTDEEDLANAYLAAIDFVQGGHGRFDVFFISGDAEHKEMNMSRAKALLGWEPKSHIRLGV